MIEAEKCLALVTIVEQPVHGYPVHDTQYFIASN
jgi:hypothetical protein